MIPTSNAILPLQDLRIVRDYGIQPQSPAVVPGIKLGQAANLLQGFRSGWVASDTATAPFFAPDMQPLPTADVTLDTVGSAAWSFPRITLYEDADSLLSAVFPYSVRGLRGDGSTFSVPSGPLLTGDLDGPKMLKALSADLGIDLGAGDAYMLVELVRNNGTASRAYVAGTGGDAADHLMPDALAVLGALAGVNPNGAPTPALNAGSAGAFVDSFQRVGTHYVSQVTAGDRIFQVFAYGADAFADVKAAFQTSAAGKGYVDGVAAMAFQYYTSPLSSETGVELGYVSQLGAVKIVSADPAFAASVKAGGWIDTGRAGGNSIFTAVPTGSKVDLSGFTAVVPIAFELAPLGNLVPVDRSGVGRDRWNRLLKGALLQKYGPRVRVTFPTADTSWQGVIPPSGGWLSTIATPTVNVYDAHVVLSDVRLTNRAAVSRFSSWSVVLEMGAGTVPIPGTDVALSSYLIDTTGPAAPPAIQLGSDAALASVALACGRMNGALTLLGDTRRKTVVEGIVLESGPDGVNGRAGLAVTGDLFGAPDAARLAAQVGNLNFALVTCQTLLYSRGATAAAARDLARGCLAWITGIIPAPDDDSLSADLAALRLRAAYLANVATQLQEQGVMVPYLSYLSYSDYISAMVGAAGTLTDTISDYQTQIRFQQNAELTAKTAEEINANIKTSGQLLINYIGAVARNEADIAANYQSIIATRQRELSSALANYPALAQAVVDQKEAVDEAKRAFQLAMANFQTTEIIKAVINISTAFATAGIAIATPSATIKALEQLGETAQQIQKLVTVLSKIMDLAKTIEGTVRNMLAVSRTLDAIKEAQLAMPTSQQWAEMGINFDASLATVPSDVAGPKADFVAAFKILVLRVQAMTAAQSKISQLNADITLNQAQKKINQDQQQRLEKLTQSLHLGDTSQAPDLSEVDLLGLTGVVQSRLNEVLGALARALAIQDSAVQFELLSPPTEIDRFDLASLQLVMTRQQAGIIAAKEAFNPPPFKVNEPIQVAVRGVPISAFTGGKAFEFQIQPSETEFQPYNMVRVQKVVVDIPAIRGSKGGQYRIDLSFTGNPFEDRDQTGDPLVFNTVTRYFGPFQYKADGHVPVFGDQTGSIGDEITRITPFSTWRVRMPDLPVNQGLDFGNVLAVDIVLSFTIEALAHPALHPMLLAGNGAPEGPSHALLKEAFRPAMMAMANLNAAAPAAAPATPPAAPLADMLSQMYKAQGVLKGWDCVLNMLEEPVNAFLAAQHAKKYPTTPMMVECGFCESFPAGPSTILGFTRFSAVLGPPLLQFQQNNTAYVNVTQDITSATIQAGSKIVLGTGVQCASPPNLADPAIQWGAPTVVDVSNKPTLVGSVVLTTVTGEVEPVKPDGTKLSKDTAHSVILDFSQGSFMAKKLNIDTNNAELNLQLSSWFQNNPISYIINTVVFDNMNTLTSLQPTSFKLNVLTTNSQKNVLQVFITTSGTRPSDLTINVNEPIPDGYQNSLMINTEIMFRDIFVQSFNKGKTNLQVAAVDPKDDFTAWAATVTQGTVSGDATFPGNDGSQETQIGPSGNTITWPLSGLRFSPSQKDGVSLSYNVTQDVGFQHRTHSCNRYGCSWSDWSNHSVSVTVTLTGNYPLQVVSTGDKQEVQIASTPPSVTVVPEDLSPTGPCGCNDNDLKNQVGSLLQQQVPPALEKSMTGISFGSVSVFALYNLLFPAGGFIEMNDAYVPGDLVVLGTFNESATG